MAFGKAVLLCQSAQSYNIQYKYSNKAKYIQDTKRYNLQYNTYTYNDNRTTATYSDNPTTTTHNDNYTTTTYILNTYKDCEEQSINH